MSDTLPTITSYGRYSSDNYGVNSLRVDVGSLTVWFSYKTPVAFQLDGHLQVVRKNRWGPTTGKHLNWIDDGNRKARVNSEDFERKFAEALKMSGLAIAA